MKNIFGYIPFILIITYCPAFCQKYSDFIVLFQPRDYTILNQYQQPITEAEKKLFVPFSPLQIVNENEVLGDQITRACKCAFDGSIWFIQKDDSGNFLGDKGKQYRPVYKKCVLLGDTVQVTAERAVSFSERFPPAGQAGSLKKGENVIRIFSYGGYCCIKRTGVPARYGWGSFSQKSAWTRLQQAGEKPQVLTDFVTDRIIERFRAANNTYRDYFDHFNRLTHQEKIIPCWSCEARGGEVHCHLNSPYRNTSQLDESTQYLVRDLENMLLGKHFEILCDKGDISVRPRSSGANQ